MLGLLGVVNNENSVEIGQVNDLIGNKTSVMLGLLNVANNNNTVEISRINDLISNKNSVMSR